MLEYGSDIAIFHGALISSLEKTQEFLTDLKDEEKCSNKNIYMQLKKKHCRKIAHVIAKAFYEIQSKLESSSFNNDVDFHRRIHASAFYAAISVDKTKDHEGYFESLTGVLPSINWSLYFELVKAFHWNTYCTECIAALPLDVAGKLVELAISHFQEEPLDNDSSILDCCIEITFRQSHSYIHHFILPKEDVSKDTNYEQDEILDRIPQEVAVTILDAMIKCITQIICSLWSSVHVRETDSNISIIKVSITTLLTFFRYVKNCKYEGFALDFIDFDCDKMFETSNSELCEKLCNIPMNIDEVLSLLKCTEDIIKEACKILTSNAGKEFIACMYEEFSRNHSWENILFGSSFYQFVEYLNEFIITYSSMDINEEFQTAMSSIKEISNILDKYAIEAKIWLSEVHNLQLWSTDISLHKFHVKMGSIIGKSNFIAEESVLEFLERNTDLLCNPTYMSTLIEIILNYKVQQKEKIIKIFLDTFQNLEFEEQKMILNAIVKSHGIIEIFKASDFNTQLVHFLNQIVKEEKKDGSKMQLQILALCLQSPYDVIRQIIMQGIKNKGGITALMQILKIISFICNYKNDPCSPSLLIKCFCEIITNEDLSKQQKENSIALIQMLLQCKDKSKYEILTPEDVLIWCIFPHLQVSTCTSLLDYSIDLLQIVITEIKFWTERIRKVAVVWCLYQVLEHYTMQRNGEKRQVIISIINSLMSQDVLFIEKDISWLAAQIKDVNPIWYLCFQHRFFNEVIEYEKLKEMSVVDVLIGGSFGLTREISSATILAKLKKKNSNLRYSYLVISLSKVLLHSIPDEWVFCFDVVTAILNDDLQISPIMDSFSNDIEKSNKNLSGAFHIFIDALVLLNATKLSSIPWHYIISCFNKLVHHALDEVENDKVFTVYIFCEICRLGRVLDTIYIADIVVPLLDIANLCKGFCFKEEYLRISLLNAIDTISAFDAVENLKKVLNQTK